VQIACPNCHTHYALDDRLVPAGGAPVQCTRCGLVFTARHTDAAPGEDAPVTDASGKPGTLPYGSTAKPGGPIRTEAYGKNPPAAGATQVFGQGAVVPPSPPAPSPAAAARTQVFGAGAVEAARTQMFGGGASPAGAPPADASSARTQVFGAGGEPVAPRTQVFGGAAAQRPEPAAPRTQVFGGAAAQQPVAARTQVFGAGEARLELPDARDEALRSTQLFGRTAGSLDLPGAEPSPMPSLGSVRPGRPDPVERALAEAVRRRNRRGVWIVLGFFLLAGGAWGVQTWLAGRSGVPASVRAEADTAFSLLRRDDSQARANSLKSLDGLVAKNPRWVGARATQSLALTLELDDQRALLKRALADADQLATQLARLEAERTPSDWRTQAEGVRTRLLALKKQTDPMIDAVNSLEARVNLSRDALNRLPPGTREDELARSRADAVFFGVAGRDKAIEEAERYKQLGGKDGWGDVGYAEYILNARAAPPESAQQALKSMEALVARDTTFLRPYVLAGRLSLLLRQREAALARFDTAVTLNPRHTLAQTLGDQERSRSP
jgi:predicted Zn finger-like uncharacterized protein